MKNTAKRQKPSINLKFSTKNLSLKTKESKKSARTKTDRSKNFKISQNNLSIKLKKWVLNSESTVLSTIQSISMRIDFHYSGKRLIDWTWSWGKRQANLVKSIIDIKFLRENQPGGLSTSTSLRLWKVNLTRKICNLRWKWLKVSGVWVD